MTSDNATTNDKCMRILERVLDDPFGRRWLASDRRARCLEHLIYLAAGAFIEAVCPTPAKFKRATADDEELADDDGDDDWIDFDVDEEIDNPVDFDAGDVLGKLLALINQVRLLSSLHVKRNATHVILRLEHHLKLRLIS